jgi:hypothetical protein
MTAAVTEKYEKLIQGVLRRSNALGCRRMLQIAFWRRQAVFWILQRDKSSMQTAAFTFAGCKGGQK